jgi:hypothetical protein
MRQVGFFVPRETAEAPWRGESLRKLEAPNPKFETSTKSTRDSGQKTDA